jgi:hypothetical protein
MAFCSKSNWDLLGFGGGKLGKLIITQVLREILTGEVGISLLAFTTLGNGAIPQGGIF